MASLKDLFISRVRVKLLEVFLSNPTDIFYVRQLVRKISEEINAVRRELQRLESLGALFKESRGNRLYYGFRKDYIFYGELIQLIAKTTGLGKAIIKNKNKLGKIKYAFLSGKLVRRRPHDPEDVDILIVGEIVMSQLSSIISGFEGRLNREINYSVMSKDEFEFRKKRRDPFILKILICSRVMLIGDEEEMVS